MYMINNQQLSNRVSDGERIAVLNRIEQEFFSTQDLAVIWGVQNRNTLRMMITRYVQRGLLYSIWRGVYSLKDPKTIHPWLLGQQILEGYSYVSCETVLFETGAINQRPVEITLVGNVSKRFTILGHHYRVRKMKDSLLYNSSGISKRDGILVADTTRARNDMVYFNSKKYYDANI